MYMYSLSRISLLNRKGIAEVIREAQEVSG